MSEPRRRLAVCLALLGAGLMLGAVGPYRVLDDYVLALAARGEPTVVGLPTGHFDLFNFTSGEPASNRALRDQGVLLPWWASDDLKLTFFRPLSSLLHRLDQCAWADSPRLMYLHGIGWLGFAVFLVTCLYRRIEGQSSLASLAALLYAVDDTHGPVAAWLSNRNAAIATCFGVLSLLAHDRARRERHRWSAVLAPVYLLLALLAGEFGLGAMGYLVAYALFLDTDRRWRRMGSLAPHVLSLAIWGMVYHQSAAGTEASGMYLHPLQDGREFLSSLPGRLMSLLGAALGPIPSDLSVVDGAERAALWVGIGGCVLTVSVWSSWSDVMTDRRARFWLCGMLFAAVPVAASFPSDRLLLLVSVGAMALVARLILPAFSPGLWSTTPRSRRGLGLAFAAVHCILSPFALPVRAAQMQVLGRSFEVATSYLDSVPDLAKRTVVVVSTPFDFYASHIQLERAWKRQPRPLHLYWLASTPSALQVRRLDANTLVMNRQGGFWSTPLERHYRAAKDPLGQGDSIRLSQLTARILSLTRDGRPESLSIQFDQPLESSSYVFVAWTGNRFEPLKFGPPGDTMDFRAEHLGEILMRTVLEEL